MIRFVYFLKFCNFLMLLTFKKFMAKLYNIIIFLSLQNMVEIYLLAERSAILMITMQLQILIKCTKVTEPYF